MPDPSLEEDRRERERLRALGDRVRAVDVGHLNDADRVTYAALLGAIALGTGLAGLAKCRTPSSGPSISMYRVTS